MGSIKSAQMAVHHTPISLRSTCQNCRHAEDQGFHGQPDIYCKEGCFKTGRHDVCDQFMWKVAQHG